MIEFKITDDMLERAGRAAETYRSERAVDNTVLINKAAFIRTLGFLGEEILKEALPGAEKSTVNTHDFNYEGRKLEVKSKSCTQEPRPYYTAELMPYQEKYDIDEYVFVYILKDFSKGWVVGTLPKADYLEKATLHKAGERNINFTYSSDRYGLPIGQLNELK